MKRDYITGDFNKDLERTIELITDKNVREEARMELADDFCMYYINFDSSRFDKYFR